MFWNDPILYGASFPYKDINTPLQTPWMMAPWEQYRRFVPQNLGFMPQVLPQVIRIPIAEAGVQLHAPVAELHDDGIDPVHAGAGNQSDKVVGHATGCCKRWSQPVCF